MAYDGEGQAADCSFKFEGFEGEEIRGEFFFGYSRDMHDAIGAAINRANKPDGTTFIVSQIEVVSIGDPNVGGYKVMLTPTG